MAITVKKVKNKTAYGAVAMFLCAILLSLCIPSVVSANSIPSAMVENSQVSLYLKEAASSYTDDNGDEVTVMPDFSDEESKIYDIPNGYTVETDRENNISLTDINTGKTWTDSLDTEQYTFTNLTPGHIYEYSITNAFDIIVSDGQFRAEGTVRMLQLDNVYNVRDLGGWSTEKGTLRYGMIYRGTPFDYMDDSKTVRSTLTDYDREVLLNVCGIQYEIDLRNDDEIQTEVSSLGGNVSYQRFPMSYDSYVNLVKLQDDEYMQTKDVIEQVMKNTSEGTPTYIHCAAGADRTGVICYLLEAVLGVPQAQCDMDYELTAFARTGDLTDRLRTSGSWQSLVEYINDLNGNTLQEKAIQWCKDAGISEGLITEFCESMIQDSKEGTTSSDDTKLNIKIDEQQSDVQLNVVIFLIYILIINTICFILVWADKKYRSKIHIKKNIWYTLGVLFGAPGIIASMLLFRNRHRHKKLIRNLSIIFVVECLEIIIIFISSIK